MSEFGFQLETLRPDNPAYMPPEALDELPSYADKLDIFSFGVLLVQILIQMFPEPTNRFKIMNVPIRARCFQRGLLMYPFSNQCDVRTTSV